MKINANLIDLHEQTIVESLVEVNDGLITTITKKETINPELPFILPGFVDAHIHIESSMLTPSQFARMAVQHGTVATVSDPHEIANVLGMEGIEFMIKDGKRVPFKFFFGAPSCVPATGFEQAGAEITPADIETLMASPDIWYLAELMNFPAIINNDPNFHAKMDSARRNLKPMDGHAPGLTGEDAKRYFQTGISTDHECFTYAEGLEKAKLGVNILIREGSAARNFDALIPLMNDYSEQIMFCSDDKHPDALAMGHINELVKRALELGYPMFDVLRAASVNPVIHYKLPVGLLRANDPADFIICDNLTDWNILSTYINGELVASNGTSLIPSYSSTPVNNFNCTPIKVEELAIEIPSNTIAFQVIEAIDKQLITRKLRIPRTDLSTIPDLDQDVLKIVVVNRYQTSPIAIGLIKGFGLQKGAIASSIAHDSHNIVAVGTNDEELTTAINLIIDNKGGICAINNMESHVISLPIAGLMTDQDGWKLSQQYTDIDKYVKNTLLSPLTSPFMTLSFMALLVIPSLKLSDKGLFDGENFNYTSNFLAN